MTVTVIGNILEMSRAYDEDRDSYFVEVRVEAQDGRHFAFELSLEEAKNIVFGQQVSLTFKTSVPNGLEDPAHD
jgi:hypothetical protein